MTGTFDRWMEQIIETSYGQVNRMVCGRRNGVYSGTRHAGVQGATAKTHAHLPDRSPQVSLSPQVDVTPTLWVPYANPTGNSFLYNDGPVHPFLAERGINGTTDYRVIMVRSQD